MSDDPDVSGQLADTPFAGVADTRDELEDASDETLIQLLYAYGRDETENMELGSLASWAYATFALRERGYVVDENSDGKIEVRTTDGTVISPSDVQAE